MTQTEIQKERKRLEVILINMTACIVKITDIIPLGCGLLVRYLYLNREVREYIAKYDDIGKYYEQQLKDEELMGDRC